MNQLKKTAMLCAGMALCAIASPLHDRFERSFISKEHTRSQPEKTQSPSLAKRATALTWKKNGTTRYSFVSSNISSKEWQLESRDTTIYDAAGNELVYMSSRAHTGWQKDSLQNFDSSVYVGNKLVESYDFYYQHPGKIQDAYRDTYTYSDNNKVMVLTDFPWDTLQNKRKDNYIDTMFFSSPIPQQLSFDYDERDIYFLITGYRGYVFNTATSSWKLDKSMSKLDAECNSTTLVFLVNEFDEDGTSSAEKDVFIFKSPEFTWDNIAEQIYLEKEPLTNTYRENHKTVYTATGKDFYGEGEWDPVTSSIIFNNKSIQYNDSHGNDTLNYFFDYYTLTRSFKTSYGYRSNRTYDANGNNTITISSRYNTTDKSWSVSTKEINTFAQFSTPVIYSKEATRNKNITMVTAPNIASFTGSKISGLNLYNAAGRLVKTIKQQASPTISLNLNNHRYNSFSTGAYLAEIVYENGKQSFPLIIGR